MMAARVLIEGVSMADFIGWTIVLGACIGIGLWVSR